MQLLQVASGEQPHMRLPLFLFLLLLLVDIVCIHDVLACDDANDARAAFDNKQMAETHGPEEVAHTPQGSILHGDLPTV